MLVAVGRVSAFGQKICKVQGIGLIDWIGGTVDWLCSSKWHRRLMRYTSSHDTLHDFSFVQFHIVQGQDIKIEGDSVTMFAHFFGITMSLICCAVSASKSLSVRLVQCFVDICGNM